MELISRMMDGSIADDPANRLQPVLSGWGHQRADRIDLEAVPIFQGCSRKQLRNIARMARIVEAPAGTVLTRRGEPGDEFFFLVDGRARVDVPAGEPVPLPPGAFFGEMSVLDGGARSATVVTDTPARLLVIDRRDFAALCSEVPDLTQTLLATLSRRVRQAEERAKRLS